MKQNKVFLLGGHDLEMLTIKDILKINGVRFYDADLNWSNANLSAYKDILNNSDLFYGVELAEDYPLPAHYIRIDHHNDYSDRDASLVQVSEILDIDLNRWQNLVAINDARYIPGMELYGASKEEINQIRLADRKAQGVTTREESDAELSIALSKMVGAIRVIKSKHSTFSPIVDRMYPYNKLLIYTDSELTYYGDDVAKIIHVFHTDIQANSAYYGGGSNGFFGLAKGKYSASQIKQHTEQIIKIINNEI